MLNEKDFQKLKEGILRAAEEKGNTRLVYRFSWWFLLPSHELYIGDKGITHDYGIPAGLNGYGTDDLDRLVKKGVLKKIAETEKDPVSMDYEIIFEIHHHTGHH